MRTIISTYKKVTLESCGEHQHGCYIKFNNDRIEHSRDYDGMVVLDYNKNNKLIGIEFVDGLEVNKIKFKNGKKIILK